MDELKIDRSFITNLSADSNDDVIVRSIIDLAHNLGLAVVAEGVEDGAAMDLLVTYGCDSLQGYFLGRPCPVEDLSTWLTESPYGTQEIEGQSKLQTAAASRASLAAPPPRPQSRR